MFVGLHLGPEPARVLQRAFIIGKGEIELEAMLFRIPISKSELDQRDRGARSDVYGGAEGTGRCFVEYWFKEETFCDFEEKSPRTAAAMSEFLG